MLHTPHRPTDIPGASSHVSQDPDHGGIGGGRGDADRLGHGAARLGHAAHRGQGETWGDEIYFEIPVTADLENDAREVVDLGDLVYWPPGHAFCIFFGPTPSSRNPNEIRLYSPANIIGKVAGDPTVFAKVRSGTKVRVERA